MTKYILIPWPESQKYMDNPDCLPAGSVGEDDDSLEGAYFVPENLL